MANLFINIPVPAANGSGAAVDMSAFGLSKTISVAGPFVAAVSLEISNELVPTKWAPLVTFNTPDGIVIDAACRWMRATVAGYKSGTPACDVGGTDDGALFFSLPVTAGDGAGAAVNVSTLPLAKTATVGGPFGGNVQLEVSEDGITNWSQLGFGFGNPGQQSQVMAAQWMRVVRAGVPQVAPGLPIVDVGACPTGGGGVGPAGPPGPPGPPGTPGTPGAGLGANVLTFRPGSADTGPLIFNDFNDLYAELVALRTAVGGAPNSGLFQILFDDQSAPLAGTVVLDSGPGNITYDMSFTEWIGALWSGGSYLADHGSLNLQVKDGGGEGDSLTIINALEFTGLIITGTGQDTVFDAQDGQVFRLNRTTFSGAGGQFVLDFIDVSGTIVLDDDSELISSGPSAVRVNNGVVEVRVNGENVYVNADAIISGVGGSLTAIINSSSAVYEPPTGVTVNSLTMVSAAGLWSPDPNAVLSAEMGVLVSDPATGFVWRNTNGVTAWAQFGAGSVFALPEQWAVQNVPAAQAGVAMSAQVSTNFDDIRMMRPGWLVGIGARVTEAITAGVLLVEATINGVIVGGAVLTVSNPPGQTLAALGAVPYVAGDLIGMKYTTDVAFLPITTDVEAWLEAVEEIP